MALHGSASANLSPILFKGNNRALGVNLIIHQDQSGSMSSIVSFYRDGTFIEDLQNQLLLRKIGSEINTYPNLYSFFDTYSRNPSTSFTIRNSRGSLLINQSFIRGESTGALTRTQWANNYFNNITNHIVNICTDVPDTTTGGRLRNVLGSYPGAISEDVHGNLWSIFTTPNAISTGTPGRFGSVISSSVRQGSVTVVITNSNEQSDFWDFTDDMINVPVDVLADTIVDPICISVIDEASPSQTDIRNAWITFRTKFPNRRFYLLQPGGPSAGDLKVPSEFTNDPLAFGPIGVNRDNGGTSTSDWFTICNIGSLPRGAAVSLAIDNSGSMTNSTVQSSINLFTQRCNSAGLTLINTPFDNELWPAYHDRSFITYRQRTINGQTGEMVFRGYKVISLSSYFSTDGYDGILFYGISAQPFGYVTFTGPNTYTITRSANAPSGWVFADTSGSRAPTSSLQQAQNTLLLASETRGALFKINRIFNTGTDRRIAFSRCLAQFIADTV